jgi:hypothetical protein
MSYRSMSDSRSNQAVMYTVNYINQVTSKNDVVSILWNFQKLSACDNCSRDRERDELCGVLLSAAKL